MRLRDSDLKFSSRNVIQPNEGVGIKTRDSKAIRFACYAAQKAVMYVVYSSIDLIGVTTVDLLVLFLILFPRFLDVGLVAIGQRVLIVVAGVLDVLAVGARNRAAVTKPMLAIAQCHGVPRILTHHSQAAQQAVGRKDRPEGSPVEHTGRLGDIVAGRMGLEMGILAERRSLTVMRIRVCGGRRSDGRSCGSSLFLVVGIVFIKLLVGRQLEPDICTYRAHSSATRHQLDLLLRRQLRTA
jgi:hypothetical protein